MPASIGAQGEKAMNLRVFKQGHSFRCRIEDTFKVTSSIEAVPLDFHLSAARAKLNHGQLSPYLCQRPALTGKAKPLYVTDWKDGSCESNLLFPPGAVKGRRESNAFSLLLIGRVPEYTHLPVSYYCEYMHLCTVCPY